MKYDFKELIERKQLLDRAMELLKEGYIIFRNDPQTFGKCDKDWSLRAGKLIKSFYGFDKSGSEGMSDAQWDSVRETERRARERERSK